MREPRQPQPGGVSATVSAAEREAKPAAVRPPDPRGQAPACSPHPGAAAADRGALAVLPAAAAAVAGQDVLQVHLHPAARRGGACTFPSITRRFCLPLEGNNPLLHRDFR